MGNSSNKLSPYCQSLENILKSGQMEETPFQQFNATKLTSVILEGQLFVKDKFPQEALETLHHTCDPGSLQ